MFSPRSLPPAGRPELIEYVYPRRTLAVRSTGTHCALDCAHCRGHYLRGMVPLAEAVRRECGAVTSYLVSGACDRRGKSAHFDYPELLAELACRGRLNVHVKLVEDEEAELLRKLAATVSMDFVLDAGVIRDLFGLQASPEDFLHTYRLLRYSGVRVVPHICLGLSGNDLHGEFRALQALEHEGAAAICFLVFRPTPGTRLAAAAPPPLPQVESFLCTARTALPGIPLYLGCLRPGGSYREALDRAAVSAGMDRIVQPARAARQFAAAIGTASQLREECCAL